VIRLSDRNGLQNYLKQTGVGTEVYYPVPLHLQDCFAYLGHKAGAFPESERAAKETLALPIYPELTESQLQFVAECVGEFVDKSAPALVGTPSCS
jgi:dTDP-4-amino-4,6-dideoxygalactose transaminase